MTKLRAHPMNAQRLPDNGALRTRRTRCNLAVLAALGLLGSVNGAWAAQPGVVLPANTIPVLRGLVSDYKNSATFTTANIPGSAGQSLTVKQLLPKIILDWNKFDIGNGSVVEFVQPSATAAVLNRIYDANPSTIQGQIKANGQVFLVNQNGILFDRGTKIDVNTLVASSLNIDDALFKKGMTDGGLFTPAFTGGYDDKGKTIAGSKTGKIVIGGNGASSAAAPQIAAQTGGAIVVLAPIIDNQSGVITSPDGQVILAAGRSVYLGFSATNDSSLRGMLVEVSAGTEPVDLSSLIRNSGSISADRGNVTLAALAINQSGRVSASSATLNNGSIYLQARSQANDRRGTITMTADSIVETPLDTTDKTTLRESDDYRQYQSVVKIDGAQIVNEGRITSHSGRVTLNALDPSDKSKARIYLAPGSVIDASGAWSEASNASNLLSFKVTSNELKDSPDQKTGILRGATVTVDLRQGSKLLDLSGYQQNQARTLAQKATEGGSVTLSSSGDVIQRRGSTVDVSGGGVRYSGGTEATTKLIGVDGKVYDIGTAPAALSYSAIGDKFVSKHSRWGFDESFTNLLAGSSTTRPDYVQGAAGGDLQILLAAGANGAVLDGQLLGGSTVGSQQRAAAPRGGSLTIGLVNPEKRSQDFGIDDIIFHSGAAASLTAEFNSSTPLDSANRSRLDLSTSLFAAGTPLDDDTYATRGFSTMTVNANGRITVPRGVTLQGPIGGVLKLQANQIEVDGGVSVPSGSITLSTVLTKGSASSPTTDSSVLVAQGASVDARGTWVNNLSTAVPSAEPSAVLSGIGVAIASRDGGSVSISAPKVDLKPGSVIDASAGGDVSRRGVITGGNAGAIALSADSSLDASPLKMSGDLLGFGFGSGGTLSMTTASAAHIGDPTGGFTGLELTPAAFSTGGFQSYTLSAGNLSIDAGALIRPQQVNLQLDQSSALSLASGSNVSAEARHVLLTDDLRKPTSLTLSASSGFTMATGARIQSDPGAKVAISAGSGVLIDGAIDAPAGAISVSLDAPVQQLPTPALVLGANGSLTARGVFVGKPNDSGLKQGNLLGGGSVTLNANKAAISLQSGSSIDVSGERQVVDVALNSGSAFGYDTQVLQSNAGTLTITGNDAITLAGSLRGVAGGNAAGGSFALIETRRADLTDPNTGRRIVVTRLGTPVATSDSFKDAGVSVGRLATGGFDKLRLKSEDEILFADDVTLAFKRGVTLDSQVIQVTNNADVKVSSSAVKLANSNGQRVRNNPDDPSDLSSKMDAALASLPQATLPGGGRFSVFADTLDLFGNVTISGTGGEVFQVRNDVRLSGRTVGNATTSKGAQLVGALTTAGDLTISAAQIYPTTASRFKIAVADGLTGTSTVGGRIDIARSGAQPGDVYSAGGSLTMVAETINQGGVVKAPMGTLDLRASNSLVLSPGSLTSVSADGLTIPYGETQSGVTWTYAPTGSDPLLTALSTPPSKRLALTAPSVEVNSGAVVDVSGGGDLAAVEFVPGSGGSKSALIQPNTYAIIPKSRLTSAPIDPDISLVQNLGFGSDSAVYNSVRIGTGSLVPSGDYVLLPGYYALLPGAYMVQLLSGSAYSSLLPGQTTTLLNGLTVVPGALTALGTTVTSSQMVGVLVRPSSDIAKLADYTVTTSDYFAKLAARNRSVVPRLPTDGGQLAISATQKLVLDGTLTAALPKATSRSAEVDIAATKVALVDRVGRSDIASDYLQIDASSLSKLDASLLIGGARTENADGLQITATASDIVVANTEQTKLKASELIIASTDSIDVQTGSFIEGAGSRVATGQDITMASAGAAAGAVLRVANSGLVDIKRPTATAAATKGSVRIELGATVSGTGSVTLDGTKTTTSKGTLSVADGGALSLVSGKLSLGETASISGLDDGLVLDNTQLAGFNKLATLSLKSYAGIDLFGAAEVGSKALKNLVLDGAALTGHASASGTAASAQIRAEQVALVNTSAAATPGVAAAPNAGAVTVEATRIALGAGDKTLSGYSDVQMKAGTEILAEGAGSLQASSSLQLQAARVASASGASQTWSALDATGSGAPVYRPVTISSATAASPLTASTALGSRLTVVGSSIADSGTIVMKSGSVTLRAAGSGVDDGVTLASGALIDAGGAVKDFKGTPAIASAGQVHLEAENGPVRLAAGSAIDVSAVAAGGDAGLLGIVAKTAVFDGTMLAGSGLGTAGRFSLDVGSLDDFSALNTKLASARFTESVDLRLRNGDISVAAGDVVKAHRLVLASDAGKVDVAGRLDASATLGGGAVELYGTGVRIASGAVVDASATSTQIDGVSAATGTPVIAPYGNGGSVSLVAQSDTLDFATGAVIDVRGGAKGAAGRVLMRAPRTTNSVQASLSGQVLSQRKSTDVAAEVVIEGNRVYGPGATGTEITSEKIDGYAADNLAYLGAINKSTIAAGIRGDSGGAQGNVHVRPAVEVRAAGDLKITGNWDLTGSGWRLAPSGSVPGEAGSLTVRAAGDLTLDSAFIGNPDSSLLVGPTWNIALASGADLTAARPMQNLSTSRLDSQAVAGITSAGDLILDSRVAEASIRTGTGNIRLSAGRDFAIKAGTDPDTAAALVGVVYTTGRAAISDPVTPGGDSRFAQGGGDVTIAAQRDVHGDGNEWMTEWFRSATASDGGLAQGAWWSYRPNFHDGVAALGGGNVSVDAGRSVNQLSAWAPTSARKIVTGDTSSLQVFGGGHVSVVAGEDIVGGQYLVSRGQGTFTAGGSVGTPEQGTQLFMMGASGDPGLAQADVRVKAGGAIHLSTIENPAPLFQSSPFGDLPSFNADNQLKILSYSANSAVSLAALGGDIRIDNRPAEYKMLSVDDQSSLSDALKSTATVYPARVAFTAFNGDVSFSGRDSATTFASTQGGLKVLAGRGISNLNVLVSDADPNLFGIQNVSESVTASYGDLLQTLPATPNRLVTNVSQDRYINDVVTLDGSIVNTTLGFPTRSRVWASRDIISPDFTLQNLGATDQTDVIADTGKLFGPRKLLGWGIGGPGALRIQTGEDLDLGTVPFSSYGNQRNQSLTNTSGASVTLFAGVSGTVDLAKLDAAFEKLIKAGGEKDSAAAKAAVDALFGGAKIGTGNIDSYRTSIQSFSGGPINLLAPGGDITVGLTTPNSDKVIGVVTSAGGSIRSYLSGDFDINQGKVLTAQGGDIVIYTSAGSIDAGRGAKTSVTTPPPSRTPILDGAGNLIGYTYTLPLAVAGSGIQTVTSKPNGPTSVAPSSGNIYLFAPSGTIDAGEAGIASGGNIFIAALTVLNADNISSAGTSVGVPQVAVGSLASTVAASGAATAAGSSKDADTASQAAAAAAAAAAGSFRPAILTVEVLGFGEKNCKEQDKSCFAK